MANFEKAFSKVIMIEGGYTNDKDDSGGKTKYGITEVVARRAGYKGDMMELDMNLARGIYKKLFWDVLRLNDVHDDDVAEEMFEQFVNMGNPIKKFVQRAINVLNRSEKDWKDITVDGKIGKNTIEGVNIAVEKRKNNFLKVLNVLQGNYYIELAEKREKDEKFINGWLDKRVELPPTDVKKKK